MKNILILMTLFFCMISRADNWVCKPDLKDHSISGSHGMKSRCELNCSTECLNKDECPKMPDGISPDLRKCKVGDVPNPASPKYLKKIPAVCSDADSCQVAMDALDCSGFAEGSFATIAADYSEAYCAEPNGFNPMDGIVSEDQSVIDQVTAADKLIQDAKDAEAVVQTVMKRQKCGLRVMAVLSVRNAPKGLSKAEKTALKNLYSDARDFLILGSLVEARALVDAATPDGTVVTAADKSAILAEIDKCLSP